MNAGLSRWLLAVLGTGLVGLAIWLVITQGPLAPRQVTIAKVEAGPLLVETFGIGVIEAQRSYALGPTVASRVLRVGVDQGDLVRAGQVVAELDPVDLDDRTVASERAAERAASTIQAAEAQLVEARSRAQVAQRSAQRSADLRNQGFVSQEAVDAKTHEARAASAAADAAAAQVAAARRDHERALAERAGAGKLQAQTRLVSRVDGVVTARLIEPGSTVVAGQAVVEIVDPTSLWVKARIDQAQAGAIRLGQPVAVVLRSNPQQIHVGQVRRLDLVSDAVTEERIVNVGWDHPPAGLALGDLVEVTIRVGELPRVLAIPSAAIKRVDGKEGVWQVRDGRAQFVPLATGARSLDGRTEIRTGLSEGAEVVVHSDQALQAGMRVRVMPAIARGGP